MLFSRIFILLLFFHFSCDFTDFFLLIVVSERDGLKSKIDALEAMELELTDQNSELQVQISGK